MDRKKIDIAALKDKKRRGEKISMLTAYDYPSAKLLDEAGIDSLLVGDSAANVVLGYRDTLPVSMDEMIMLTRAVVRGAKYAFIIGDMPYMSYNVTIPDAIANAGRFIKEAGADAVKIEGGAHVVSTLGAMVRAGIPCVGHLGLTPQTANMLGGYHVQGRDVMAAKKMVDDAVQLEDAGAIMIVLECVPDRVAGLIAAKVSVPVIGIGAGPDCDGQVLVLHDMLGFKGGYSPKFVKAYAGCAESILNAARAYHKDVTEKSFPTPEQSFAMEDAEFEKLKRIVG